ncbi:MAG: ELM1/GtrOC1 family putative glycosyltransferase, partial [Pseudomonadota bacterium]|nr:ELM1/GtrOC1 family putative glycosyltransferase [Pseudomonadota bacterium]
MAPLKILHLSDDRPGHYHLAEGVIAAISRISDVEGGKISLARRWAFPGRYLRSLANRGLAPGLILRAGYGIDPRSLPKADLVISAGGETLPANIAAARKLGAANIFCGSLRSVSPERFSLIVSSYERHAHLPRHLVGLKPCGLDPDELGRPKHTPTYGSIYPPKLAGLLIGGNSGFFKYDMGEWEKLLAFTREVSAMWGTRWLISTSRRTDPRIAETVFELAKDKQVVADFVDYRWAGPGTLERIFSRADIILSSEDSSTMISEA